MERQPTLFDFAAEVGLTKHFGGVGATEWPAASASASRNREAAVTDELKVSLVTGACILTLAVVAKWVLGVKLDFVSQYAPVWIYIVYLATRDRKAKAKPNGRALAWTVAIVVTTIAVLVVYAW